MTFFTFSPITTQSPGERRKVRGVLDIRTLVIGIYLGFGAWLLGF